MPTYVYILTLRRKAAQSEEGEIGNFFLVKCNKQMLLSVSFCMFNGAVFDSMGFCMHRYI